MHCTTNSRHKHRPLEGINQRTNWHAVRRRSLQAGHHISAILPVPTDANQIRHAHLPSEHQPAWTNLPGHSATNVVAESDRLIRWAMDLFFPNDFFPARFSVMLAVFCLLCDPIPDLAAALNRDARRILQESREQFNNSAREYTLLHARR